MSKEPVEKEFTFKDYFVPLTTTKAIHFIIIIGILLFSNGLFNNFLGDDIPVIVENAYIRSLQNIPIFFQGGFFFNGLDIKPDGTFYKPFFNIYLTFLYSNFGPNVFVFHFVQLILHICNAILVYFLFKKSFSILVSFILATVFLIHPINSESVLYMADAQEVVYLFLGLLSFYIIQNFTSLKSYILAGVLLFCSILSKEAGVLFFFIIPIYLFLFKRERIVAWLAIEGIATVIYTLLRASAVGLLLSHAQTVPIQKLTLEERLTHIPEIVSFYLTTFFFPYHLSFSYNWTRTQITFEHFYLPLMYVTAFSLILFWIWKVISKKESIRKKTFVFYCLWLFIGLSLHIQIIPLDATVADRWFYFPIIGMLGLIGIFSSLIKVKKKIWLPLIIILLSLLFTRTFIRTFDFRDEYTLVSHDIKISQENYNLENGLASELIKKGKYKEAEVHALASIKQNPAWNNYSTLGVVYLKLKDYKKAKAAFLKSLSYSENYLTYKNLAALTLVYGDTNENITFIKDTLKTFPRDSYLWLYLAILYYREDNYDEAKYAIEQASQYNFSASQEINEMYATIINKQPLKLEFK